MRDVIGGAAFKVSMQQDETSVSESGKAVVLTTIPMAPCSRQK